MVKAERFVYDHYEIDDQSRELLFHYSIVFADHTEKLMEKWVLPAGISVTNSPALDQILKSIHLAAGISYFKTFIPPVIETPYGLTNAEATFWNTVYENGLAEFCYVNKISEPLAKFSGSGKSTRPKNETFDETCILGIGGGKDSIVASELMLGIGLPVKGFVLTTGDNHGQSDMVTQKMGIKSLGIERFFDTRIIELQKSLGGLNGHVPISVMFALSGVLLAQLTRSRYVAVGNEASSSIPNLFWNGREVNHQWSKSLEFERLFQKYVHENITPAITYFSAIRPLSSVAVTKLFSAYPQYFEAFTSCNRVFRIDPSARPNGRWCGQCDKCLSSFLLFAPWLDESQMLKIFGENLLDKESLRDSFLQLLELEGHKPLDCVGTPEELQASLAAMRQQNRFAESKLLKMSELDHLPRPKDLSDFIRPSTEHAFPDELAKKLINAATIPEKMEFDLKHLAGKDIVCIGKAREGQSLEKFLASHDAPINSFRFVDQKDGNDYLEKLDGLDQSKTVFFKSAGIPGRLVTVPYTTPMNLFFSLAKQTGAKLIGITGTKGKTTTSALLHHMLKADGKKSILCGNIGVPALDKLDELDAETTVVIELGAYHCADLQDSPDLAIYTNLENDHLPYFGTNQAYRQAKQRMIAAATDETKVVYPESEQEIANWVSDIGASPVVVNTFAKVNLSGSKLIGAHNQKNVLLAMKAAELCGVEAKRALASIDSFQPLEHRLQVLKTITGKTFIDDAIGSTPEATLAGIEAISASIGPIGAILLGGEDRSYDFGPLIAKIAELNIPCLVLFPDTGKLLRDKLPKDYQPRILETKSMSQAVTWANESAPKGSVILLSTAAPSYSLWPGGFEEKGKAFQDAVSKIRD